MIYEVAIRGMLMTFFTIEGMVRSNGHVISPLRLSGMRQALLEKKIKQKNKKSFLSNSSVLLCFVTLIKTVSASFIFLPNVIIRIFKWTVSSCLTTELCFTLSSTCDNKETQSSPAPGNPLLLRQLCSFGNDSLYQM